MRAFTSPNQRTNGPEQAWWWHSPVARRAGKAATAGVGVIAVGCGNTGAYVNTADVAFGHCTGATKYAQVAFDSGRLKHPGKLRPTIVNDIKALRKQAREAPRDTLVEQVDGYGGIIVKALADSTEFEYGSQKFKNRDTVEVPQDAHGNPIVNVGAFACTDGRTTHLNGFGQSVQSMANALEPHQHGSGR